MFAFSSAVCWFDQLSKRRAISCVRRLRRAQNIVHQHCSPLCILRHDRNLIPMHARQNLKPATLQPCSKAPGATIYRTFSPRPASRWRSRLERYLSMPRPMASLRRSTFTRVISVNALVFSAVACLTACYHSFVHNKTCLKKTCMYKKLLFPHADLFNSGFVHGATVYMRKSLPRAACAMCPSYQQSLRVDRLEVC
eukprot:SAG11_NODE_9343_length_920_cov_1.561510_1_plen_196_part_00